MPYEEENYEEVAKEHEGIPLVGEQEIVEDEFDCVEEICEIKWRALIFICFLTFGGYYIYDFPGSLGIGKSASFQAVFEAKGKEYTSEMNQALYSMYSIPNCVAATIGGILIDNIIGLRKALMLFVCLDAIGAAIFYFGVMDANYPVMALGRICFGLGNESLSVAQQSFVARFFRGRRGLALAFGIVISFSRVGSSFNFLFSPQIAEDVSTEFAALVGVFACLLSVAAAIILVFVDLYSEKKEFVPKAELKNQDASGKGGFRLSDLKALNKEFFCITMICISVYCSVFPFVGVGKPFFERKYEVSATEASTYISFFQFACAGFSPFTGGIVDKIGYSVYWMGASGAGFTLVHALFIFLKPNPIFMTIFMGVIYSILAASLWPAIPYVIAPASTALAYGGLNSLQNAGLAIFPLISGAILDAETGPKPVLTGACLNYSHVDFGNTSGFAPGSLADCGNTTAKPLPRLEGFQHDEILFGFTAAVGVIGAILLGIFNKKKDGILLCNNDERKVIFAAKIERWKEEAAAEKALLDEERGEGDQQGDSNDVQKEKEVAGNSYGTTGLSDGKAALNPDSSRTSSVSMQRHEE